MEAPLQEFLIGELERLGEEHDRAQGPLSSVVGALRPGDPALIHPPDDAEQQRW